MWLVIPFTFSNERFNALYHHSNAVSCWLCVSHFFMHGAESTTPVYSDPLWLELLSGIFTTNVIPAFPPSSFLTAGAWRSWRYFLSCNNCKPNAGFCFFLFTFCLSYLAAQLPPPVSVKLHRTKSAVMKGLKAFPGLLLSSLRSVPGPAMGSLRNRRGSLCWWEVIVFFQCLWYQAVAALFAPGALIVALWTDITEGQAAYAYFLQQGLVSSA